MATVKLKDRVLVIPIAKPRVKDLNQALVSLGGGRMKGPKDWDRIRDKKELRALLKEESE